MIEKYIQFAIDNELIIDGNKVIGLNKIGDFKIDYGYFLERGNIIELITSKPFIEAVARGIKYKTKYSYGRKEEAINEITTQQAIAIRENKLEEFIKKILPKK